MYLLFDSSAHLQFFQGVEDALKDFCAESTFHESREPLVLVGPSGSGKSTVLANWMAQRRHASARRARLSSLNPKEEFVFWHAAGCSRQSSFVGSMLRRLMSELRTNFEISREVSLYHPSLPKSFWSLDLAKLPMKLFFH